MGNEYDSPWKQIIERYFQDFLAFFFREIHADIDWDAGYTFLDKELETVVRDAALGARYVDKLVQITRLSGDTGYVYLHIEVQGEWEDAYGRRMFRYFYRLLDKYEDRVVSLSVLADTNPNWRPESYEYQLWGCRLQFAFPTVKLLNYMKDEEALSQDPNPFAVVVQAHHAAKQTAGNPEARIQLKLAIAKDLYRWGYGKQDIINLFAFIDWVMALPEEDENRFWQMLKSFEGEKKMAYVTSVQRIGRKEGRLEALKNTLYGILQVRLEKIPEWINQKIEAADESRLQQWAINLALHQDLDQVFQAS